MEGVAELAPQVVRRHGDQGRQKGSLGVDHDNIVHVAPVVAQAQVRLHEVVERAQVEVGVDLGRQ